MLESYSQMFFCDIVYLLNDFLPAHSSCATKYFWKRRLFLHLLRPDWSLIWGAVSLWTFARSRNWQHFPLKTRICRYSSIRYRTDVTFAGSAILNSCTSPLATAAAYSRARSIQELFISRHMNFQAILMPKVICQKSLNSLDSLNSLNSFIWIKLFIKFVKFVKFAKFFKFV